MFVIFHLNTALPVQTTVASNSGWETLTPVPQMAFFTNKELKVYICVFLIVVMLEEKA